MRKYEYNGVNLIADDSTLKSFCTSLYRMMPTDYEGEDRKWFIMSSVRKCLENELPQTCIDYEGLLRRYIDELGDLIYRIWDHDRLISTPDFLGEGAERFFNDIVCDYIYVHYKELSREGLNTKTEEENKPAAIHSWDDLHKKYPVSREEMSEETEREFISDCYDLYEKEGFAKRFWTPYEQYKEYIGEKFSVKKRIQPGTETDLGVDLECLPMWIIAFNDGKEILAHPEEVILSEMISNGYSEKSITADAKAPECDHPQRKLQENYTVPRNQMTEEQEKAFVIDSFILYEAEGFSEKFWSSDKKLMRYNGMPFEVVGRTPLMDGRNKGVDLRSLPMWDIVLENGIGISAYPSEIIPSVMKENGCPLFRDESDASPLPASPNSYLEAKEELKCYIIRFAKENNWDYENVPEQIRAFFTTWCFLFHIDADTRECDETLNQIHWLAALEEQISYEDFESYMVNLIV